MISRILDWVDWYVTEIVFATVLLVVIGLVAIAMTHKSQQKQAFLDECIADGNKNYECVERWRAGEPDYVPVVVPVYTGQ